MRHKALLKLIACYIISIVAMFILLNFFGSRKLNSQVLKERLEMMIEEAGMVAEEYVTPYYRDAAKLGDVLTQLRSVDRFLGTRTWVINTGGIIIVDTASEARGVNVDSLDPEFLNRVAAEGYLTNVTFPRVMPKEMLAVAQPIYNNYKLRGYVCMFSPMELVREMSYQYLDIINICLLVFSVLLLLVFVYLYFAMLAPVGRMTRVAEEYARGHFDVPVKIRSHDEYRDLANAIQYMAAEFQRLDEYQKKFVANISHDFRSPLTSIKGYAEAMADGTIPTEMQAKYLDIILFETERLTTLTSNLLLLNSFGNTNFMLEIISFDINEIIRRTALAFEGRCTKKRITLNLVFHGEELFVDADMGKIQQVLYNLIDNAIKFSNADSTIDVKSEEKGSKVFVSVKDYGIGIPKDSINKVWERFYKTDLSRGKDKKGTGLGLSIAREIVMAHKENINVVSTEGAGTEFMFTLPKTVF